MCVASDKEKNCEATLSEVLKLNFLSKFNSKFNYKTLLNYLLIDCAYCTFASNMQLRKQLSWVRYPLLPCGSRRLNLD